MKHLFSTAYHPQTDGQSERSNQIIEIVLRFLISTLEDPANWSDVLDDLQSAVNNSFAVGPGKTPNEIVYGFIPVRAADLIRPVNNEHDAMTLILIRREISDAIAFAQLNNKAFYDRKHQAVNLKAGDFVLLRLHKGYNIPSVTRLGRKLSQQYVGPFKILAKVGNLTYHLKLSISWRVHPVFIIAQLEPCPDPAKDPFGRARSGLPGSVHVDGDTDLVKSFEVEKVITHRTTKRRGTEYLFRWKGYEPEHDEWRNIPELGDAMNLVRDYEKTLKDGPGIGKELIVRKPPGYPRENQPNSSTNQERQIILRQSSGLDNPVPASLTGPIIRKRGRPRKRS